jgi:hypothetical protein
MAMQPAPQGAPEADPAPQAAPGGASQIVAQVHDGLMKLMDLVQGAKLPDQDVQQLGQIVTSFQGWVDELSKPAGGPSAPEEAPQSGAAPMESGGNPNSKPV